MGIPAIQAAAKFHELRNLKKVMSSAGLGNLVRAAPRELVKGLRKASPETRKLVAKTFMDDLGRVQAEIERLGKLRSAVAGSNPEIAARLASRAKMLSNVAAEMEYRAPFFRQSGWDRTKRMAGLGLNTWWGGQSLYDAYNDAREGNYGRAAYHLAVAPMFGLGSVANHASRGLSIYGKSPKLAKALNAFGKLEHKMVAAGKYGTSGNAVTRWMMRHPFLTAEGLGTAVGAPTMLSTLTGGSGEDVQSGDIAADGGDLVNYGIPKNAGSRRDFSGLERRVDMYLQKEADSILGRPDSVAGTVGQTALYMTPVLGSALSVADGVNDMFHGRWKSGLGNLALGVGTGLADFLSFGTAGTAIKGLMQAGKLGARASKVGKGAGLIGRNLAAAKGFAKGTAGMALNLANRGAKTMLGAKGYAGVMNAGRSIANASRQSNAFFNGYKAWRPVRWAANTAVGRNAAAAGKWAFGKYRNLPGYVKFPASMAAYSYIPGMDLVAQATPFGSMRGRMLQRALFSDGGMMIPGSYQDAGRAENYEGPSLRDMAGMGRLYDTGEGYGHARTIDGAKTPGWQYRR